MNIVKLFKISLILITLLSFYSTAFADKGVFNAKVTPDEFFTNTPTTVTITAEIGVQNYTISSISAYQTTADGKPLINLGAMYDDGTHGDAVAADTIYTMQFNVNRSTRDTLYTSVTVAYSGDRNRYLSPTMAINTYVKIPVETINNFQSELSIIKDSYIQRLSSMTIDAARMQAYLDAKQNPDITEAILNGANLSIVFQNQVRGLVSLDDPDAPPTDGTGSSMPSVLPENYKTLGNDKLLIFAPGYNSIDRQNQIADSAKELFDDSQYMTFDPKPSKITQDSQASLDVVKHWGDYGTVIIHTHSKEIDGSVYFQSGTKLSSWIVDTLASCLPPFISPSCIANISENSNHLLDLISGRLVILNNGAILFGPGFINRYVSSMNNTFFYLGACGSLANDTMWNALKSKGAKVAFGWSSTVHRLFNLATFKELIHLMLPIKDSANFMTAIEAYDSIPSKTDPDSIDGVSASLILKTAKPEWENMILTEGGIINGDFEIQDWRGWFHSSTDIENTPSLNYSGVQTHQGSKYSTSFGFWDKNFALNPVPAAAGLEYIYQDFIVPTNKTYLKFYWWEENIQKTDDYFDKYVTRGPAIDAYIEDSVGNRIEALPARNDPPDTTYTDVKLAVRSPGLIKSWTTKGWQESKVDISAYRGQKLRINFNFGSEGLSSYGPFSRQARVYIDDVSLE